MDFIIRHQYPLHINLLSMPARVIKTSPQSTTEYSSVLSVVSYFSLFFHKTFDITSNSSTDLISSPHGHGTRTRIYFFMGKVRLKVLPWPNSLSTHIRPP